MTTLKADDFITKMKGQVVLDIRTPAEFNAGHLPGAISFPLFSDEERVIVGTIYKQQGRDTAVLKGLDLVGPKLKYFVLQARKLKGSLYLYCWRGGMRSNSMAWLLQTAGREVFVLEGGYKAYRTHCRELISNGLKLIMLSGPTGSGKTEILHQMEALGHQVLDLEGLANHRGSSFGGIGQPAQPGTEQFTNLIFEKITEFDLSQPIWVEGESQAIGKVSILSELFSQMDHCPTIRIDPPKEARMDRLMRDYAGFPAEELQISVEKISKRLGGKDTQDTLEALSAGDYRKVVEITLAYYDKAYDFSMARRETRMIPFVPTSFEPLQVAKEISEFSIPEGQDHSTDDLS
ncbi:MAG: tRNA 2-selenouridine(34) synthase MnmH [Prolixibacteraceae bacterium]